MILVQLHLIFCCSLSLYIIYGDKHIVLQAIVGNMCCVFYFKILNAKCRVESLGFTVNSAIHRYIVIVVL